MDFWTAVAAHVLGGIFLYLLAHFIGIYERRHRVEMDLLVEQWVERTVARILKVKRQGNRRSNPLPRKFNLEEETLRTVKDLARKRGYRVPSVELRLQVQEAMQREGDLP